ncbi:MAG: hypothetical protein HY815_12765 [Candidatus Riflebacteria bacterium]|nr:hypothetical protein [Candidatus Riflebacteria bacterium]
MMILSIHRDSIEPIWAQIRTGIKQRILTGALEEGVLLPAPLELAVGLPCHPAAVERAYADLIDAGWILETASGAVAVATGLAPRRKDALERGLSALIDQVIRQAHALGITARELVERIDESRTTCPAPSR